MREAPPGLVIDDSQGNLQEVLEKTMLFRQLLHFGCFLPWFFVTASVGIASIVRVEQSFTFSTADNSGF